MVGHESQGEGTPPQVVWTSRPRAKNSDPLFAMTAPPVTSEWPPRYLVVECMTKSQPRSSGRCTIGAQVLSHAHDAPAVRAISATAEMSVIFRSGFEGVSVQMSFVVGRIADF